MRAAINKPDEEYKNRTVTDRHIHTNTFIRIETLLFLTTETRKTKQMQLFFKAGTQFSVK